MNVNQIIMHPIQFLSFMLAESFSQVLVTADLIGWLAESSRLLLVFWGFGQHAGVGVSFLFDGLHLSNGAKGKEVRILYMWVKKGYQKNYGMREKWTKNRGLQGFSFDLWPWSLKWSQNFAILQNSEHLHQHTEFFETDRIVAIMIYSIKEFGDLLICQVLHLWEDVAGSRIEKGIKSYKINVSSAKTTISQRFLFFQNSWSW